MSARCHTSTAILVGWWCTPPPPPPPPQNKSLPIDTAPSYRVHSMMLLLVLFAPLPLQVQAIHSMQHLTPTGNLPKWMSTALVCCWWRCAHVAGGLNHPTMHGSVNFVRYTTTAGPGNPLYAAPEANDPHRQSPKMDVYSFALAFLRMLTHLYMYIN